MAEPQLGVIGPWITPEDVLPVSQGGTGCCPGLADPVDEALLAKAIIFATNILFRASGRQFPGTALRTGIRPCRGYGGSGCGCSCTGGAGEGGGLLGSLGGWNSWAWESALGGWTANYPYAAGWLCGCGGGCNGCELPGVILSSPVVSVEEVVINGFVVDPSEYGVQDYRSLVRYTLDSNGCLLGWPCENVRSRPSSAYPDPDNTDGSRDKTWEVSYTFGRGPGEDGKYACAQYACQLALIACNARDANCRLPYRTQSVIREGLTLEMIDPSLFLMRGMTGLPEVDQWVQSVNPGNLMRRPSVSRLGRPSRNITSITG